MTAAVLFGGVVLAFEDGEGRALIFPATGGIGEITLLAVTMYLGLLLYEWGVRRDP
jgi:tetrahydromethanopterin S-methyltransferase subunit D